MTSMRVRQSRTRRAERRGALRLGHRDQLGDRLGHRDGVHGDVRQVDPGHRALGGPMQVGLGHVLGGDAGQQVGGMDDEVVVEPHLALDGTRRLFGQGDEDVGGCRIGPALEQPGQQQIALLPPDQVLVVVRGLAARQQLLRLQLDQDGRHEQELGQLVEVDPIALLGQDADEAVDDGQQRDVEDVDLVGGHEVQQEVDRTLEDRRGDRVGHPPTLPNRPGPPAHPAGPPPGTGLVRPTMAPHEQGPLRHRAFGQLHLGELPRGPAALGVVPGRVRRLLLRGGPARAHHRDRPG